MSIKELVKQIRNGTQIYVFVHFDKGELYEGMFLEISGKALMDQIDGYPDNFVIDSAYVENDAVYIGELF